jgi:type IV secretory pathway TrbF-like protein
MNLTTDEISKVYELTKDIGLEKLTRIVLNFNNLKHLEQEDNRVSLIKEIYEHINTYSIEWNETETARLDAIATKVMLSPFMNEDEKLDW